MIRTNINRFRVAFLIRLIDIAQHLRQIYGKANFHKSPCSR